MSYLDQLFSLENQTAVVIGGTGVLCGEMAQGIAKAGADTIIVGRNEEKGKERVEAIEAEGGWKSEVNYGKTSGKRKSRVRNPAKITFG